ncbi:hypothetical protein LOK49_LG11G00519 [Camellia lanceoleosa]|uniref:Uncharacterized protein n=1 Tax=Camellia lanceoleosa TaxID=1840588 RepID=A0ACC0G4E5_9ERIC|nr:hypothetical protein LOK49_LG11G00519 [Camellia lanceoleosa]
MIQHSVDLSRSPYRTPSASVLHTDSDQILDSDDDLKHQSHCLHHHWSREFDRRLYAKSKPKVCGMEIKTDQQSVGSSDEIHSPRSIAKFGQWTPKNVVYVHSQILRIKDEDSHLCEDFSEVSGFLHHHHDHQEDWFLTH